LWVSDGDTAVIQKEGEQKKVRFLLIDCTEMHDKKTGKPQPFAEEAKARTKELLESAKR